MSRSGATALRRYFPIVEWARDYDGGSKCQVAFDDGTVDLVPGSRVVTGD